MKTHLKKFHPHAALRSFRLCAASLLVTTLVSAASYEFQPMTIANGGGTSAGGQYTFTHTIGQLTLGNASSGNYNMAIGFVNQIAASGTTSNVARPTLVDFGGLPHVSLGSASLSVSSNGMQLSNIGSNGADGVTVGLQELSRTARLKFTTVSLTSPGAGMSFATLGMINHQPGHFFGTLRLQNNAGTVEIRFDPGPEPVASTLRVQVYNQGVLAGTRDVPANGLLGTLSGPVRLNSVTAGEVNPSASQWTLWEMDFADVINFTGLNGNRIRVSALNPVGVLQNLMRVGSSRVDLQACKLEYSIVSPK